MEDLKVYFDLSVRTSSDIIVQFIYGEDGMDSISVESQSLIIMKMTKEEIIENFGFDCCRIMIFVTS